MADKNVSEGDRVSWIYASHQAHGIVSEISTDDPISITTAKGNEVTRDTTEDNPAVKVDNLGEGQDVVKRMREVSKEGENKGEEMKGKGKAKENEDIEEVQGKVEGEVEQGEAMEVDVEGAIELDTEMKEGERESDAVEGSKTKDGTKGEVGEKRPHSDEVEVVAEQEGTKHDEGAEPEAKKPKLGSDVGDKEEQRQKQGIGEESVEEHERTTTDHEDEGQKKSARTKQTAVKRGPGRPRKGSVAVKKAEAPVEPGKTRVKVKAREKN